MATRPLRTRGCSRTASRTRHAPTTSPRTRHASPSTRAAPAAPSRAQPSRTHLSSTSRSMARLPVLRTCALSSLPAGPLHVSLRSAHAHTHTLLLFAYALCLLICGHQRSLNIASHLRALLCFLVCAWRVAAGTIAVTPAFEAYTGGIFNDTTGAHVSAHERSGGGWDARAIRCLFVCFVCVYVCLRLSLSTSLDLILSFSTPLDPCFLTRCPACVLPSCAVA